MTHTPTTPEQLARLHDMLFEQSGVPLALIDLNHRFVRVNTHWAAQHRRDVHDFPGRRYAELFPGDAAHIEKRTRLLDQVITERKPLHLQGQPFKFPGQPERGDTWWDWTINPLCDERGQVELVMFVSVDATERVNTERELAQRNDHSESLLRLSRHFEGATSRQELVNMALTEVTAALGYRRLWVYLFGSDRGYADLLVAGAPAFGADDSRVPIPNDTEIAELLHARDILVVEDARTDARFNRGSAMQPRNRTIVNVPIALSGRNLGAVGTGTFDDEGVRVPTAAERAYLLALAGHLAVSLDRIHSLDELRRNEQALRASEQRFRGLFEHHNAVMLLIDPDTGAIVDANAAAARFYGYPSESLRAMTIQDINRLSPEEVAAERQRAMRAERNYFIFPHRLANGSVRTVEVHSTPVNMDNKALLFSIVHDITERLRAERQLALLSVAVDNVREAAYLIDPTDGHFLYVNEEASRMLGYTREELVGKRPQDIDPSYAQMVASNPDHGELMGRVTHFETQHRTRDGRLIPVEITFNRFQHEGQLFNMALVRDITEHKRAQTALHRVNRALKTLSSGNEALVRAETEQDLLDAMCRVLVETGGYRQAWIGYAEHDETGTVRPVAWHGAGSDGIFAARVSWADTGTTCHPAGTAIRTGAAQVIHDVANDPAFARERDMVLRAGLVSCIAIPLGFGGSTQGALCLYSDDTDAYDPDEVTLLLELGGDLSYGIHALRTRSEKERGLIRLQSTMEATIQALANTVELRDPYTAGHQQRVARLAEAVARRLQLPDDRILGLRLAAAVHDIGKIFIPAEILSRPGKLTRIEYEMVQSHVDAGYDILRNIDFPWPIADVVRQHHERLDGSGYPQGLKGDAIILDARILAVADVVEAMSTHRPYRPGLGTDAAVAEITAGRGLRFDADVVDAVTALLRDGEFRFE